VARGGDTAANAAIVGAILGAAKGIKIVPQDMITAVVEYLNRDR
jgi:ADP-ribosylglycohydrolase